MTVRWFLLGPGGHEECNAPLSSPHRSNAIASVHSLRSCNVTPGASHCGMNEGSAVLRPIVPRPFSTRHERRETALSRPPRARLVPRYPSAI
jgi:hypothetical protein